MKLSMLPKVTPAWAEHGALVRRRSLTSGPARVGVLYFLPELPRSPWVVRGGGAPDHYCTEDYLASEYVLAEGEILDAGVLPDEVRRHLVLQQDAARAGTWGVWYDDGKGDSAWVQVDGGNGRERRFEGDCSDAQAQARELRACVPWLTCSPEPVDGDAKERCQRVRRIALNRRLAEARATVEAVEKLLREVGS